MTKLEYDQKRQVIIKGTFSVKERVQKLRQLDNERKAAADKIGIKKPKP